VAVTDRLFGGWGFQRLTDGVRARLALQARRVEDTAAFVASLVWSALHGPIVLRTSQLEHLWARSAGCRGTLGRIRVRRGFRQSLAQGLSCVAVNLKEWTESPGVHSKDRLSRGSPTAWSADPDGEEVRMAARANALGAATGRG
jgi:hypothetical protein